MTEYATEQVEDNKSSIGTTRSLKRDKLELKGMCLRLGVVDDDDVGLRDLGTHAASGVVGEHDDDLETADTRAHEHVLLGDVLEDDARVTSLNHVTVTEDLAVGTLGTGLAAHRDLAATGARLHDETDDAVAGTTDRKTLEELVLEGLALSHGAETAVHDALDIELDLALVEAETLLDDAGKLADALAVLTEDHLGAGGADDDLSAGGSAADLNTGIAHVDKLTSEELAHLRVENSVRNKLSLLAHTKNSRHIG